MTKTELSQEAKDELKRIVSNDASFGAFTGMLFNASHSMILEGTKLGGVFTPEELSDITDGMLIAALEIRVRTRKLSK